MSQGREAMELPGDFPERIGRYEVLLPIARGGMGAVYLARARGAGGFEREVALKLLHRHAAEGARRGLELVEEAKLAVLIRHPNVVQVLDVDEGPLGVFMVMEYVEGASLADLLRAARDRGTTLPPEIGLRILLDALAGLHAAHELLGKDGRPLGLVHRDFSPQNILVGADGTSKLADFGIAKAASRSGHTVTGTIKGKVAYAAPEQLGGGALDRRCDVWAAGVVAWEILAGRHMHEDADDVTLMYRIAHEPAPRLRAAGIDAPVELDDAIHRALARSPASRPPTAAAFARTLEASGVEVAPPDEVAAYVRRHHGEELAARRARIARIAEQARGATPAVTRGDEPVAPRAPSWLRGARVAGIAAPLLVALGAWWMLRPTSAPAVPLPVAPESGAPAPAPTPSAAADPEPASAPTTLAPQAEAPGSTEGGEAPLEAPIAPAASSAGPAARAASPSQQPPVAAPAGASSAKAGSKRGTPPRPLAPSPYGRKP